MRIAGSDRVKESEGRASGVRWLVFKDASVRWREDLLLRVLPAGSVVLSYLVGSVW